MFTVEVTVSNDETFEEEIQVWEYSERPLLLAIETPGNLEASLTTTPSLWMERFNGSEYNIFPQRKLVPSKQYGLFFRATKNGDWMSEGIMPSQEEVLRFKESMKHYVDVEYKVVELD